MGTGTLFFYIYCSLPHSTSNKYYLCNTCQRLQLCYQSSNLGCIILLVCNVIRRAMSQLALEHAHTKFFSKEYHPKILCYSCPDASRNTALIRGEKKKRRRRGLSHPWCYILHVHITKINPPLHIWVAWSHLLNQVLFHTV